MSDIKTKQDDENIDDFEKECSETFFFDSDGKFNPNGNEFYKINE